MSDFECRNGHLMRSSDTRCKKCGASLYSMDGLSRKMANKKAQDEECCSDTHDHISDDPRKY